MSVSASPPPADDAAVILPRWTPAVSAYRHLYVFGLDPGAMTGWAVLRLEWSMLLERGFSGLALHPRHPELFAWDCGIFAGPETVIVDQVLALMRGVWRDGVWDDGPHSDVMVASYESFRLRILSSDENLLSPVRILAMLRYAGRALPFPRVQHSPSDAKTVVTDARLKHLSLYLPGPDHPRDALRQAVLTARKMVEEPFRVNVLRQCAWLHEEVKD